MKLYVFIYVNKIINDTYSFLFLFRKLTSASLLDQSENGHLRHELYSSHVDAGIREGISEKLNSTFPFVVYFPYTTHKHNFVFLI